MKADLHMHTFHSDGKYSPEQVIDLAIEAGMDIISITDHDVFEGVRVASQTKKPIRVIYGIELSTYWNNESIHILGYFPDLSRLDALDPVLKSQVEKRKSRAIEMLDRLKEVFHIDLDRSFLTEIDSITRGTIAYEIIRQGFPYTRNEIFDKMIGQGCPAYIPSSHLDTRKGIQMIKEAGGLAVLAHPMEYKKNNPEDLVLLGVDGIEAIYPNRQKDEHKYRRMARKYDLFVTAGTDFHDFHDGKHGHIGSVYLTGTDLELFLKELYEH